MIRVEHHGPVTILLLDRPEKRNALLPEMLLDLGRALASLPATTRVVVMSGRGDVFCSGFDLAACAAPDGVVTRALLTELSALIAAMKRCPHPVVLGAQGAAIAGGCALLGGADVVVSDLEARLGYPVLRLGISPAVSAPFLAAHIGQGPCRARLLDTGLISGHEAMQIGLVHEIVGEASLVLPRARELAERLAAKPAGALAATKAWLQELELARNPDAPRRGLEASLAGVGGEEERLGILTALSGKGRP